MTLIIWRIVALQGCTHERQMIRRSSKLSWEHQCLVLPFLQLSKGVFMDQSPPNQCDQIITYLKNRFDGYPFDADKDIQFVSLLNEDFCHLNILEELKLFHTWIMDVESPRSNLRTRFRKWLMNSNKWRG
jgi:hypothetical protein